MYLRNEEVRNRLLDSMFSLGFANDEVRDKIGNALRYRLGPDFGVEFLKTKSIAGKFNEIDQLEDRARAILDDNVLNFVFDRSGSLKDEFITNPGSLIFLLIALEAAKEADPYADTYQSWFERTNVDATSQFMSFYRRATPVPFHYGEQRPQYAGANPQDAAVYGDAVSLRAAMQDLVRITGLFARDVHGGNVMVRPETGDLVIVDLGLFKPRAKQSYNESKCGSKRKVKVKFKRDLDERCQKGYKTHPKRKTKKMFGRTYRNCVKAEGQIEERELTDAEYDKKKEIAKAMKKDNPSMSDEDIYPIATATAKRVAERKKKRDPKKGTGKKPKGSGRRLYTDEDPSDTVSVSFKSVSAIKKTLAKSSFKSKSHKRQSQIINLIHQRSRAAYRNAKDPKVKARLKKAYNYAKKRKETSKKKTIRMRKNKK